MTKAPTITDIARRTGVHRSAVAAVLNGGGNITARVSDKTRERIVAAAAELHYVPNAMARGLNGIQLKSIGISFANLSQGYIIAGHYSSSVLRGILDATFAAGYNTTIFQRPWLGAKESAAGFRSQGIDGFLIVAPLAGSDMVAGLSALGIPIVVVSTSAEVHNVPSVDVDNVTGVRLMLDHLLGLGHRRIAHLYIGGGVSSFDSTIRRESFINIMANAGVPHRPEYLRPVPHSDTEDTVNAIKALMSLPEPPTALFTTNDTVARHALQVLSAMGIRVPEQISVAGFDDRPDAATFDPPLTTIRQPLIEMGAAATRMLISLLAGEDAVPETHWFEPELIVRKSTGPVPEHGFVK